MTTSEKQVRSRKGRPQAKRASERQRHPTEVRRRLVIEAARDLIADLGMANVTVRDLSEACEVSPGTITYHFHDLAEVLWEVVKAETSDFYQPLQETTLTIADPVEALRTLLDGLFRPDDDTRRHWQIWLEFWAAASRDDDYGDWMSAHYDRWRGSLQELCERGMALGVFTSADPAAFAIRTAAMVDGLATQCYTRSARLSVPTARHQLLASVAAQLKCPALTDDNPSTDPT